MSIPDYRIRFDAPRIDFDSDVGNLGQDIDNYPAPNSQARFDHFRMVILGLLSNQASTNAPTQYREGSLWFDLKDETLKIRRGDGWVPIAESIVLDDSGTNDSPNTLAKWFESAKGIIESIKNDVCYNGVIKSQGINSIPIPTQFRNQINIFSRPFVYVNGLLLQPTSTNINSYNNPTSINTSQNLEVNSRFTVLIKNIPNNNFLEDQIVV